MLAYLKTCHVHSAPHSSQFSFHKSPYQCYKDRCSSWTLTRVGVAHFVWQQAEHLGLPFTMHPKTDVSHTSY